MSISTAGLTRSDIAALVGMSDSWVRDRILAGQFPRPGEPAPVYVQALLRYRGAAKLESERTRLISAQAEAQERKNRETAGETIEMEVAEAILFEMARTARDAWMNWPSRVAPIIAAAVGIEADQLLDHLNTHVHQQLADLGEPEGLEVSSDGRS